MAKVSIQMCCYNGEAYLREAVDSVIAQTHQDWELIFWDNCSTDKSAAIIKSYKDPRIKYHLAPDHTDSGGGRARSWPLLTGEFFSVLDVDDLYQPEKLEKQLALFDDPEVSIVIGDVLHFSEHHGQLIYDGNYPPTGDATGALLRRYFISCSGAMVRRSAIEKTGQGFDPDFNHISDFDVFVRASAAGKLAIVKQHVSSWRIHFNSISWTKRDHDSDVFATENKFVPEHFKWIERYKNASWLKPYRGDFIYHQYITVARKLYFALIDDEYRKDHATGLLRFLDILAWMAFYLLRWTPFKSWVRKDYRGKILKWSQQSAQTS